MRTIQTKAYKFSELSDTAKATAIEKWREDGIDYEWWDYVYEDAKTIGALMGITITNIHFSGFWPQGDGACFEGSYEYRKGNVKAVKDHAPVDKELHRIAEGLRREQARNFYALKAYLKQTVFYYSHEHTVTVQVENERSNSYGVASETEEAISELLRDFMRWIYRTLENEYDYLTSDEAIAETLEDNEYEFTGDGKFIWCANRQEAI